MITAKDHKDTQALHNSLGNISPQKPIRPRWRKIVKVVLMVLAALLVAFGIFLAYVYPGEYLPFEERKDLFCEVYHVDPSQAVGTPCPVCNARGNHPYHFFGLIKEKCEYCHGVGWVTLEMEKAYYSHLLQKSIAEREKAEDTKADEEQVETLGEGVFPNGHTYYYVSQNGLAASVRYYIDKQDERCLELGGVDDVQYNGTYVYSSFRENMNDFRPFAGYQNRITGYHIVNGRYEFE